MWHWLVMHRRRIVLAFVSVVVAVASIEIPLSGSMFEVLVLTGAMTFFAYQLGLEDGRAEARFKEIQKEWAARAAEKDQP